jgi:hypothetical protein
MVIIQSFKGALHSTPLKALLEALLKALYKALLEPLHEALPEALYKAPSKLYTELPESSAWSSTKALHGALLKPCMELH